MEKAHTTILYHTKTGHSRRIAEAVAAALGVDALDATTKPAIGATDVLIIVGGIYGGVSDPKFIEYLQTIDSTQVGSVALMTSCMSKKTRQEQVRAVLAGKGIAVDDAEFICQGGLLFLGWGHPNKQDLAKAIEFAREVVASRSAKGRE